MKRNTFSILRLLPALALILGLASTGKAQLRDKATFFGGINYNIVSLTPLGSPAPTRFPFYGIGGGMDYVLAHSNDQFSLGANPNANFSFFFSSFSGSSLLAQAPVFALARYGANATPYNQQRFGIGAGLGGVFTYMRHNTLVTNSNNQASAYLINEWWVNPGVIVEISLKTRWNDYLFRLNWSLSRPTLELEGLTGSYRMATGGLSIMYTF